MPVQVEGLKFVAEGVQKFINDVKMAGLTWDEATQRFKTAEGKFVSGLQIAKAANDFQQFGKVAVAALREIDDEMRKPAPTKMQEFGKGFTSAAGQSLGLQTALGALAGDMTMVGMFAGGLAVAIGKTLVESVQRAVGAIGDLAKGLWDLAKAAAPIVGMDIRFRSLTDSIVGGSNQMMRAMQKASLGTLDNMELMLAYNRATSLVSQQFAERLPEALNYLTKISQTTGRSMDYLFDSLIWGIGRLSPRILDNLNVQVRLEEGVARAAAMFGKEADALSTAERQAGLTAVVFEKLAKSTSGLPDISQTATIGLMRLDASFRNIRASLGQFLLPAFTELVSLLNRVVEWFAKAIQEGGALYPWLVRIGAAASLMVDGLEYLADQGLAWIESFAGGASDTLLDLVSQMFGWGMEIVGEFAAGIVSAASTVLVAAMNFIGDIIESWLGPGSAPRITPDLAKWGAEAFTTFLEGMTAADFDVLEAVQGPLRKVLGGQAFADLSKILAASLAGGDRGAFLEQVRAATGMFGEEVGDLAERQFALADATAAVKTAEDALQQARDRASRAQTKINVEVARYNEMLRKGADEKALKAQLDRVKAAEAEGDAALKAQQQAEAGMAGLKEREAAAKEALGLQERLLAQLVAAWDALTAAEREEKKEAAKKEIKEKIPKEKLPKPEKPLLEDIFPEPKLAAVELGTRIMQAVEEMKARLKEAMLGAFSPITEAWKNMQGSLGLLGDAWERLKGRLAAAWDEMKARYPGLQELENWVLRVAGRIYGDPLGMVALGWEKVTEAMRVWYAFCKPVIGVLQVLSQFYLKQLEFALKAVVGQYTLFFHAGQALGNIMAWNIKILIDLGRVIGEVLVGAVKSGGIALDWFRANVLNPISSALSSVAGWFDTVITKVGDFIRKITSINFGKLKDLLPHSPSPLAFGLEQVAAAMDEVNRRSLPGLGALAGASRVGQMLPAPAMAASYAPAPQPMMRAVSVTVGPNYIGGGLDMAAFELTIRNVLRRELGG